jgi:NAD(P)-dependent dehydrogenase (short-subunit alcohol dehydrogenase family)
VALSQTAELIATQGSGKFEATASDISQEQGRQAVADRLGSSARIRYLVHLAGTYPTARFEDITVEGWRQAFGINAEARLFLTRTLLPMLVPGARIAIMHSGTGEVARRGAAPACGSIAASNMVRRCLQAELSDRGFLVSATKPGAVKSDMMDAVIAAGPDVFPFVTTLLAHPFVSPETCARYLYWWLTKTDDRSFMAEGWDILDSSHHAAWLGKEPLFLPEE